MDKELELLMELIKRVRDENDYFTPKQLYNEMKREGLEIRRVPNPIVKVAEKINGTVKNVLL